MAAPPVRPLLEAAAEAYQREDFEASAALAERACKRAPDNLDAWDFHSLACQALGDPLVAERSCRKALALLRKAKALAPDDDKLALREVMLLIRLGRDGEIESLFHALRARHPENAALQRLMASWRLKRR